MCYRTRIIFDCGHSSSACTDSWVYCSDLHCVDHYFVTKQEHQPRCKACRNKSELKLSREKREKLKSLKNLENLENFEKRAKLDRLEKLERLEKMEKLDQLDKLERLEKQDRRDRERKRLFLRQVEQIRSETVRQRERIEEIQQKYERERRRAKMQQRDRDPWQPDRWQPRYARPASPTSSASSSPSSSSSTCFPTFPAYTVRRRDRFGIDNLGYKHSYDNDTFGGNSGRNRLRVRFAETA